MAPEPDALYTLRNLFWLGNYQLAINEANSLRRLPKNLESVRDEFVYRSYLALGQHKLVMDEIREDAAAPLQAIRLLATYFSNPGSRETIEAKFSSLLSAGSSHESVLLCYAIFLQDDEAGIEAAIRTCASGMSMELIALRLQLYLRIHRLDLAQDRHRVMKGLDEDSPLTGLASAWINMATGGSKCLTSAVYTYEELLQKYGKSVLLLNGLAVAKMHQGFYEEAEGLLQDALTKDSSDADSLANIITVSYHLDRSAEVIQRYLNQLKMKAPKHPLVAGLQLFESAYDRVTMAIA